MTVGHRWDGGWDSGIYGIMREITLHFQLSISPSFHLFSMSLLTRSTMQSPMISTALHRHIVKCVSVAGRDMHRQLEVRLEALETRNSELERRNKILIMECLTAEDALAAFDGVVTIVDLSVQ